MHVIVAEISKNWRAGRSVTNSTTTIAMDFEKVINTNLARGYRLRDWQLSCVIGGMDINETIIAVFDLVEHE